MNDILNRIAREIVHLKTLETRWSDSLDFHDLAVWSIKAALEAAYQAGFEAGKASKKRRKISRNPLDKKTD